MKRIWTSRYFLAGTTALLTFAAYLYTLGNDFVEWDDITYVVENPFIRSLNASFFRRSFLDFYAGNWHPLTWLSYAADYAIWGLKPFGYHLTNIILHSANTFAVVILAMALSDAAKGSYNDKDPAASTRLETRSLIAGVVTGLLFGFHPLHVESVAWVAERKDLLCSFFFLLSLMTYMRLHLDQSREAVPGIPKGSKSRFLNKYYILTLGFFTFALLSKPMAVSLPAVLIILDWYPLRRIQSPKSLGPAFAEKIPFIALSLISSALTIMAQRGAIQSLDVIPISSRLLLAAKSIIAYLGKMVLPVNLLPFYPYPKDVSIFSPEYLWAIILVAGITAACVAAAEKQKLLLSVWGYYVVTLIPVLGLVQVGIQAMADRYTYLPGIGPFLLLGITSSLGWERMKTVKKDGMIVNLFGAAVALCATITMVTITIKQIGVWKNSVALWSSVIKEEPVRVPLAYNNRGIAFKKMGLYEKAVEDYDKAITLKPSFYQAYTNRGIVFERMGLYEKAVEDYDKAIALNPSYLLAYNSRGIVFKKMGLYEKAVEDYDKAIALNPSSPLVYINRGVAFRNLGRYERAVEDYDKAIALNPYLYSAFFNRGIAHEELQQSMKAIDDYGRAIDLNRTFTTAYLQRGRLRLQIGLKYEALSDFRTACDLGDKGGCETLRTHQ